ncbi:MAG: PilZ domain-containing protein [Hyphomicrobiaceae bacterium]
MLRSYAGVIGFASGHSLVECVVQNASASGAQLRVADAAIIPKEIQLQDETTAHPRLASVVWRRTGVIGVRFHDYFLRR